MAELDPYLDRFLDNVLRGKSNAELYQIEQGTSPLRMPETVISAPAARALEPSYMPRSGQNTPQVEGYSENINPVIERLQGQSQVLRESLPDKEASAGLSRSALLSAARYASEMDPTIKPSFDYPAEIMKLQQMDQFKEPEKDLATVLIENLAAPLAGAMLGESGMIAQARAQENINKRVAEDRKFAFDKKRALLDEVSKRMVGMRQLMEGEAAINKDQVAVKQNQLKDLADRLAKLTDSDQKELDNVRKQIGDIDKEINTLTEKGAGKISDIELRQAEEKGRNVRAAQAEAGKAARGKKIDEDAEFVPGYVWNKRTQFNKTDIPKLQDAISERDTINNLMNGVISKVQSASAVDLANPFSEVSKSIKGDLRDIQLSYKGPGFANLGVLTGPDLRILEEVIDTPNLNTVLTGGGKEALIKRYQQAIGRINDKIESKLKSRGFSKAEGGQQETKAVTFPITVRKGGKVAEVSNQSELDEALSEGWAR